MNENFQGQIILVTGAGSGIGRTTAIELARGGHIVYASMRVADLEGERWASLRSVASEERLDLRPLERAADAGDYKWLKGGNPRDLRLYVPVEFFTRQITTAAFPIGVETFGVSNLLTWSACARAGANFLTHCHRNHHCDRETGGPVEEFVGVDTVCFGSWRLIAHFSYPLS